MLPVDVTLRDARLSDAEAIAKVHVGAWREAYRGLMPDELLDRLSVQRRAEQWRGWLPEMDAGDVAVAERDGQVIGFVWVGAARDDDAEETTGELLAIYLRAEHWDTGVGRALHAKGSDRLRACGFARVTLWVLDGNDRARRFYERQGWATDGTAKVEEVGGVELREVRYARAV